MSKEFEYELIDFLDKWLRPLKYEKKDCEKFDRDLNSLKSKCLGAKVFPK